MPALTLSMIAAGVRGGATTAYQVADSKPGKVSAIAGTSGRLVMRCGDATAMSFNLPALTSCSDTPRLSNMQSTLPATRSLSAGAEPRYGTFCNFLAGMVDSPLCRTRLARSLLQLRQTVPQPPAFALRQTVEFDLLRGDAGAALCGENMTMRVSQVAPTVALTLALLGGLAACGKGPQGDQGTWTPG